MRTFTPLQCLTRKFTLLFRREDQVMDLFKIHLLFVRQSLCKGRPSQLPELSRSEFDPELFSYSAYVNLFVIFATKVQFFNISRQNLTIFDIGNG